MVKQKHITIEQKLIIEQSQLDFLKGYKKYGFSDESEMIRTALYRLQLELDSLSLQESADLYAEVYQQDEDLQEITSSALAEWPQA